MFSIIDTWEWIPQDKIDNLFEKFTQVESALQRNNTSGLWLWLAIAKDFILKFWWKIYVKSEVWKWSTFYFMLNIVE
jgi:signal transduction histidine kinase